jgi:hypothetical protein
MRVRDLKTKLFRNFIFPEDVEGMDLKFLKELKGKLEGVLNLDERVNEWIQHEIRRKEYLEGVLEYCLSLPKNR